MLHIMVSCLYFIFFFFNDTATTEIYTLSLHDALPICGDAAVGVARLPEGRAGGRPDPALHRPHAHRSEEHTSELQSQFHLVCRLLLEKKKKKQIKINTQKKKKPKTQKQK